jgi:hypothetical protein
MRPHKFKYYPDGRCTSENRLITIDLDKVEAYEHRMATFRLGPRDVGEPRDLLRVNMTGGSVYDLWCSLEEFEAVYLGRKPREYCLSENPGIGIGNTKAVGTYDGPIEEHAHGV